MKTKKIKLELTEEEAKLVLEAMLFFSSVDVCSNIETQEAEKLYDTIEKVHTLLKPKELSVYIYGPKKAFEQKEYSSKLKKLLKSE